MDRHLATVQVLHEQVAPQTPVDWVVTDMVRRWQDGERPSAEDYLSRYPDLEGRPDAVVKVIYEEICLRQVYGEPIDVDEVYARFPQWREQLEAVLDCQRLLEDTPAATRKAPARIGDYTLLTQLGRGGHGAAFLAVQGTLEDRPVVIKISPSDGREHLTLAQLQHTNIVPLYAAHEDPQKHQRILCMPYLGGAAFSDLLQELQELPVDRRTGRDLLAALDRLQARLPIRLPGAGWARQFVQRASYVQVISWVGACLADALHYAHAKGLLHLDVKPSNILLAADGQPLLLDFHLASQPFGAGERMPLGFGGTPLYMAPEQRAALQAGTKRQPVPAAVDARADVYGLGLVLFEALGGSLRSEAPPKSRRAAGPLVSTKKAPPSGIQPAPPRQRPSALGQPFQLSPQALARLPVSTGLKDILAKCLADDPQKRYADAKALAEDLRCHLKDLPLRGVPNRSLVERWRKWRRRKPSALSMGAMALAVLAAGLSLFLFFSSHFASLGSEAEHALAEGQDYFRQQHYGAALASFQRGLECADHLSDETDLVRLLNRGMHRAKRACLAEKLHVVADQFRFADGAMTRPLGDAKTLAPQWHQLWEQRTWLLKTDDGELSPALEQQLTADYLDLVLIWSDMLVSLADPAQHDRACRDALQILTEAEVCLGSSMVLGQRRGRLARLLGDRDAAAQTQDQSVAPRSAWEYYALGRACCSESRFDEAARLFHEAVTLEPQSFWTNFYVGVCAYRRKDFTEAITAFRVSIALAPHCAECHVNRGLAHAALGQTAAALEAYAQALRLDPHCAAAIIARQHVLQRVGGPKGAT